MYIYLNCSFDFYNLRSSLVRLVGVGLALFFWSGQIITTALILKEHPDAAIDL